MSACFLVKGGLYSFLYPRYNYCGLPESLEMRRIRIVCVRDLNSEPLDETTSQRNPTLRRGRFLVTATDLDLNEERHFYFESMTEIRELDSVCDGENQLPREIRVWFVGRKPFVRRREAESAARAQSRMKDRQILVLIAEASIATSRTAFQVPAQSPRAPRRIFQHK